MTHLVEITEEGRADLEPATRAGRVGRVLLGVGFVLEGTVRCYAIERGCGRFVEVGDIALADGSGTLVRLPCSCFRFLDRDRDGWQVTPTDPGE
jgi:hypothetical protein